MLKMHSMPMIAWVQAMMISAGLQAMMLPLIPTTNRTDLRAEGQRDSQGRPNASMKVAGKMRSPDQKGRILRHHKGRVSMSRPSFVASGPTRASRRSASIRPGR